MKDKTALKALRLSDDELAALAEKAQSGDEKSLEKVLIELSGMVRAVSRAYYFAGGERDDVIQEGMIGLFMAVMNYDSEKGKSFLKFANTCVNNRIASAVKSASRKKHSPLNFYVSVGPDMAWDEHTDGLLQAFAYGWTVDPESLVIRREDERITMHDLEDLLTPLEKNVLICYLRGMSYEEISEAIGKTEKSVANAVFRVKRKLRNHYTKGRRQA
ncbi:MAG: sigma-70 family RNA polymerase sigma factor [Clostridia bacterium]|nr:sigma-70 family RNA polymerase sigma factor [Clostridia bacterium]